MFLSSLHTCRKRPLHFAAAVSSLRMFPHTLRRFSICGWLCRFIEKAVNRQDKHPVRKLRDHQMRSRVVLVTVPALITEDIHKHWCRCVCGNHTGCCAGISSPTGKLRPRHRPPKPSLSENSSLEGSAFHLTVSPQAPSPEAFSRASIPQTGNSHKFSPVSGSFFRSTRPGSSRTAISQVALIQAPFRWPPNTRP